MQLRFSIRALASAGLLLAILCADEGAAEVQTPGQAPVSHTISVNPQTTKRDSTVEVTVANAPVGSTTVTVFLDGQALPTTEIQPGTYAVSIPPVRDRGQTGSSSGVVPLGKHRVGISFDKRLVDGSFDKRWFTGDATLTIVNPNQVSPVLTDVQQQQLSSDPGRNELTLTGNNFIVSPPEDNQIVIGGVIVPVKWTGCPAPSAEEGTAVFTEAHGKVESVSQIQLCYLKLPPKLQLDVMVKQGETPSNVMQVYVLPWSKTRIVLLSLGTVLGATALVIFLASFLRKYSVNNTKYGMFRILYLDPETNSYSLSKYQFYMWTAAALFSYTYLALSRVFVQGGSMPDVPGSLPGIIGIGAGTAIGAQLVTSVRGPKGGGSELPSLGDFVTSGGVAAPERVQMFVWTNLGALLFCIVVLHDPPWHITNLPTLGDGLMYLMGISSAGYLGGKLARKPGPVLSEISVSPDAGGSGGDASGTGSSSPPNEGTCGDLSQPIAAAQQASRDAQSAIRTVPAASSPAAFAAAQSALKALRDGIAAAGAAGPDLLSTLADNASAADASSQLAAAEFTRVLAASAGDPDLGNVRALAEQAQRCAAAAQDLASGVSQAAGTAQAAQVAAGAGTPMTRTIELRGRNLSLDATFEINNDELPFRMLANDGGTKAPKMVAPEDDSNQAKMARELRLSIDPSALGQADRKNYDKWFGSGAKSLQLAITNPDGQRSEISFTMPPGSQQARG